MKKFKKQILVWLTFKCGAEDYEKHYDNLEKIFPRFISGSGVSLGKAKNKNVLSADIGLICPKEYKKIIMAAIKKYGEVYELKNFDMGSEDLE